MSARRFAPLAALCLLTITAAARADLLDDILERGTIRIGVSEFVPWTMRSSSGALIGFEVDLAKKLAADMGVKADIRALAWEGIIGNLQRGEIDVIAAGMAITPERALKVNFSQPIARSGVGLATNTRLTADMTSISELDSEEIIIATVAKTLSHEVSKSLFEEATIVVFDDARLAEKAVLEGEAHAYLASMPEAVFLSLRNAAVVDIPIDEPLLASSEGLAVRKGEQELLNFLNAWVVARQTDKWIPSTRDYWFRTLDWAQGDAR